MTIAFKDFIPTTRRTRVVVTNYENVYDVVLRANEWIARHNIAVLNVETLLLPALPTDTDAITHAHIAPESGAPIYQAIRVWYEDDTRTSDTTAYTGATMTLAPPRGEEQDR
jgi:hypothetical protein